MMFFNELLRHKTLMSEETLQTQKRAAAVKMGSEEFYLCMVRIQWCPLLLKHSCWGWHWTLKGLGPQGHWGKSPMKKKKNRVYIRLTASEQKSSQGKKIHVLSVCEKKYCNIIYFCHFQQSVKLLIILTLAWVLLRCCYKWLIKKNSWLYSSKKFNNIYVTLLISSIALPHYNPKIMHCSYV